jgi:hypothetical protein
MAETNHHLMPSELDKACSGLCLLYKSRNKGKGGLKENDG